MKKNYSPILWFVLFLCMAGNSLWAVNVKVSSVAIVVDCELGEPARHGLDELEKALKKRQIPFKTCTSLAGAQAEVVFVVGYGRGGGEAAALLRRAQVALPQETEAMAVERIPDGQRELVVIAGADDAGLMYAALDVADRIGWADSADEPLQHLREVVAAPYVKERGIALYTMHRRYWEERFYSEDYLQAYFDMMARNRLNMLEILFGYENGGFMAPCYPYFFDVEGFPEVKMEDITPQQQAYNVEMMHRLIRMAHERGIKVRLGVWDHLYRGGVQAGGNPDFEYSPHRALPWQVTGLDPATNLIPYTQAAFAKLLKTFPEVDAILFKTNNESGLKTEELHQFSVSFFKTIKAVAPQMQLDIHSKGITDALVDSVAALGLNFRIAPKFWMEQLGLPYSPTHVNRQDQKNRRHGYADFLKYPQRFTMLWKLWNGGTNRAFLWGDPEYVRCFVRHSRLYGSSAYAVYEPLATKMESRPHDEEPFQLLTPEHRYYTYEFERWWYFYLLWGRLGYDPQTPPEVWQQEFIRRFGEKDGAVLLSALGYSSQVMPRIVAACYPYQFFPTTSAWPEKQRLGDLPLYATAEGSDLEQFASFDEEAQVLLGLLETGKVLPSTTSRWLWQLSRQIDSLAAQVGSCDLSTVAGREMFSTVTDLRMLSRLALYHSRRVPAAVSYCLFKRTHDVRALDEAIRHEENAIAAYRELVEAAGDVYSPHIYIGNASITGHWRDELKALNRGLEKLKAQRAAYHYEGEVTPAPLYRESTDADMHPYFAVEHQPLEHLAKGEAATIRIKVGAQAGVKKVVLHYRAMNQYLDFDTLPMTPAGAEGCYEATIPVSEIVPAYDLMYLIEVIDRQGRGIIYPDVLQETPYRVVSIGR